MAIHWPTMLALLRAELRMLLRDRRTVVISLVLPLVITPVFLFGSRIAEKQREKRIEALSFEYAVVGSEASLVRALIAEGTPLVTSPAGASGAGSLDLTEVPAGPAPRQQLAEREIALLIESFSTAEVAAASQTAASQKTSVATDAAAGRRPAAPSGDPEPVLPPTPAQGLAPLTALRLVFAADWDYSQTAMTAMMRRLEAARAARRDVALTAAGAGLTAGQVAVVTERVDLATAGQRTGLKLGRFALTVILMFLLTGGSVIAADTLAGEKERGTLETLLTTAGSRLDIVTAKMAAIFVVGATISVSQVLSVAAYIGLGIVDVPESFRVELTPLAVLLLLAMLLPLAALVAGVLLWVSGRSRSYKEFQFNFFPISLLALLPGAAAAMPGVELRSAIVLVPIANLSVAVREILVGTYDWPMLAVAFAVSAGAAWWTLRGTLAALSAERLITQAEVDEAEFHGGQGLFERHIFRNFAIFWVVLFLANSLIPALAESVRWQLLFNLVGVFLGGSWWMIRHYRLEPQVALSWRPVPWMVWLATVAGAPAVLLCGIALARVSAEWLPVPRALLEAFGRALVPADLPIWQVLLGMAVLPGICEEIAFRGVLLNGLRRRFHPVVLCLVVGLIFGLFHFALFRLVSTAFLGAVLTALTLLSGSIKPAMVWHALNNACALLAAELGFDLMALDRGIFATAALVAGLCFWILWRYRSPVLLAQPRPSSNST